MISLDTTSRGFAIARFIDHYGEACSLQKSSLATRDCIWLGRNSVARDSATDEPIDGRMHLTQTQVASLLPFLKRFVLTGELHATQPTPAEQLDMLFMAELEGARDACLLDHGDDDAWKMIGELLARAIDALKAAGHKAPSRAAEDVLAERRRHVEVEGWTPEHDDEHDAGEMVAAAAAYAMHAVMQLNGVTTKELPSYWPWAPEWWKPGSPRRNLEKSGALIIAEIERLDRAEGRANG